MVCETSVIWTGMEYSKSHCERWPAFQDHIWEQNKGIEFILFCLPFSSAAEVLTNTSHNSSTLWAALHMCLQNLMWELRELASVAPSHPSAEDLSSPADLSVPTQLGNISLNWSFAEVTVRDFFSSELYLKMKCIRYWCVPNSFEFFFSCVEMEKQKWERGTEKEWGKKRVCYDQRDEENGREDQRKDKKQVTW